MQFMLQKEVFNSLVDGPGNKTYGRLTEIAQYYCQIIPVLEVPPHSFTPPPKVDSAVVRLVPYAEPPYPVSDVRILSRITTEAFGQRRKTLRNSLSHMVAAGALEELSIDPTLRAENVSVAQYCQLANWLANHQGKSQE